MFKNEERNNLENRPQKEILQSRFNPYGDLLKKEERNSNTIDISESIKNKYLNNINNFEYKINRPKTQTYTEKIIKTTVQYNDNNNERKPIIKEERIIRNKISNSNDIQKEFNNKEKVNEYNFKSRKYNYKDNIESINSEKQKNKFPNENLETKNATKKEYKLNIDNDPKKFVNTSYKEIVF